MMKFKKSIEGKGKEREDERKRRYTTSKEA